MPTLDERIEAARKLVGYTPGPWRVGIDDDGNPLSGRPGVFSSDELDCGIVHWDGFVQEYWRSARGDKEIHDNARLIAAAPDLHRLALDLAADREWLLAICRDVPGVLNAAFAAGAEECEGGSARRQEKAMASVDDMLKRIRAAFAADPAPQPDADERGAMVYLIECTLQEHPAQHESAWHRAHYVADALLAAGWTHKQEEE